MRLPGKLCMTAAEEAREIAIGISAHPELYYVDMTKVADRDVDEIASHTPSQRVSDIKDLVERYGQPGDNEATCGMTLAKLLALEFIDDLIPDLESIDCILPIGYIIRYGSGMWGERGDDQTRPAFSIGSAHDFIECLRGDPKLNVDEFEIVRLGNVSYVELAYALPGYC